MIRNRILKYIDFKGISKYKFYKDIGVSNGFLDKEGSIRSDICEKISYEYVDLNLIWLISGKGKMIVKDNQPLVVNEPRNIYNSKTDFNLKNQQIPLYNVEAVAGITPIFTDLNQQEPTDYLNIPNAPKCDGAIYATGDSMYPLIKSGDIIAYKIIKDFANDIYWGQIYILFIDIAGDLFRTVKYVKKGTSKDKVLLISVNKHHEDKEVHLSKIKAMAQVKLSVRIN